MKIFKRHFLLLLFFYFNNFLQANVISINTIRDIYSINSIKSIIYIKGYTFPYDGGGGYFRWDKDLNKSSANGGTIIDSTQSLEQQGLGQGKGCWVRIYNGYIQTKWFGIKTDGSDSTKQFNRLIKYIKQIGGGVIMLPPKTISVGNLDFTACNNITIIGQGKHSIIDFKYAKGGIGMNFGSSKGVGGTQYVSLYNFTLTNSKKSKIDTLLEFRSGPTKKKPVETSGFISLKNIFFKKGATKALSLVGVSHLSAEGLNTQYNTSIDYALYISQDIDINTGVFTFTNCIFRAKKTALVIEASHQLIDTILFHGCGFFNYYNPSSREVILLNGKNSPIESVKFLASHIESRNSNKNKKVAIGFKGKLQAISFDTIHLSCGTSNIQKQADYAFMFYNHGVYKELDFNNISILRCKSKGYVYYIEGFSCKFYKRNPIRVKGLITNVTNPSILKVDFKGYNQYLHIQGH